MQGPTYMETKHLLILIVSPKQLRSLRTNIFACLLSIHNIISLSCHEQVCLILEQASSTTAETDMQTYERTAITTSLHPPKV